MISRMMFLNNNEDKELKEDENVNENNSSKRFKIKEIRKLEKEASDVENNILNAGIIMLMSIVGALSVTLLQMEEFENFVYYCRFIIILIGVKGFGALVSSISKKCDLEKQIKNLKNHINFDEYDLDEQFEEDMKRR